MLLGSILALKIHLGKTPVCIQQPGHSSPQERTEQKVKSVNSDINIQIAKNIRILPSSVQPQLQLISSYTPARQTPNEPGQANF